MGVIILAIAGCKAAPTEKVVPVSARSLPSSKPAPSVLERLAAQHISADEIYTVYSQNLAIGALPDQRFRDHLIWVTGVFNGVNGRLAGRAYLELRTHDDSGFTYAVLSPDAESLLPTLVPGMSVELLCRGAGAMAGSPLLVECRGR